MQPLNMSLGSIVIIGVVAGFSFAAGKWLWSVAKSWFIDDK